MYNNLGINMSVNNFEYSREALGALMHVLKMDRSLHNVTYGIEMVGHLACLRVSFKETEDSSISLSYLLKNAASTFAANKLTPMKQRLEIITNTQAWSKHSLTYLIPLSKTDPLAQVGKVKEVADSLIKDEGIYSIVVDGAVTTTESLARATYRYALNEIFPLTGTVLSLYSTISNPDLLSIHGDAFILPSTTSNEFTIADFNTVFEGIYTNVVFKTDQTREFITIPYITIRSEEMYVTRIPGLEPTHLPDNILSKILNEGENYVSNIATYA